MSISKQSWKEILSGNEIFEFESLSLKILLAKLKLKYKIRPDDIDSYVDELLLLLKVQKSLPSLMRDIERITCRFGNCQNKTLYSVDEVVELIVQNKTLLIAGDEALLKQLPKGNWIAGTIPYFITDMGGITTKEQLFVNTLPDYLSEFKISEYTTQNIHNVYNESYQNGFSIIIIPATSDIHFKFALEAPNFENFATTALIGWISGVDTDEIGSKPAKVAFGNTATISEQSAVVMHIKLPDTYYADLSIVNIFEPDKGDILTFENDGFSFETVIVNGEKQNFVDYFTKNNIDIRQPLVADYFGVSINTSFQTVDVENNKVNLYAPVFKHMQYNIAKPIGNYVTEFNSKISDIKSDDIAFSCNCILNYKYGELEGKKIQNISCPITFGEIAYQLVNQTFAFVSIKKH